MLAKFHGRLHRINQPRRSYHSLAHWMCHTIQERLQRQIVADVSPNPRVTGMAIAIATQNIWGRAPFWNLRKRALAATLGGADIVVLQEVQARRRGSQAHELAGLM